MVSLTRNLHVPFFVRADSFTMYRMSTLRPASRLLADLRRVTEPFGAMRSICRSPRCGWTMCTTTCVERDALPAQPLTATALVPVLRSRTATLLPLDFTLHGGRGAGGVTVTGACTVTGP